ncbi:MAG: hypothetical protein CM15mP18_2300 [Methanobacteriota archaeon]|nr:MAG: hypothetical protein CM15mP18_2300 [Euryarchaeota archaeon]
MSATAPFRPHGTLAEELRVGDPVLLADGLIRLEVEAIEGSTVKTQVLDGGHLSEHKGINVPRTKVSLPAIGARDEACLRHALELEVDFVAVSYVRSARTWNPRVASSPRLAFTRGSSRKSNIPPPSKTSMPSSKPPTR